MKFQCIKPILRFSVDGKLIARYDTSEIYSMEGYNQDSIFSAIANPGKKYKKSLWMREYAYTKEFLDLCIEKGKQRVKNVPLLAFDKDGKLVKKYNNMSEVLLDGYNENAYAVASGKFKTHGGLIWMREKDYSEKELKMRLGKLGKRKSKWSDSTIQRITTDGIFIDEGDISFFTNKGFDDSAIYRVLNGVWNTHKGFQFIKKVN